MELKLAHSSRHGDKNDAPTKFQVLRTLFIRTPVGRAGVIFLVQKSAPAPTGCRLQKQRLESERTELKPKHSLGHGQNDSPTKFHLSRNVFIRTRGGSVGMIFWIRNPRNLKHTPTAILIENIVRGACARLVMIGNGNGNVRSLHRKGRWLYLSAKPNWWKHEKETCT